MDCRCRQFSISYELLSLFHGGNTGSNPVGDAKSFQQLTVISHVSCQMRFLLAETLEITLRRRLSRYARCGVRDRGANARCMYRARFVCARASCPFTVPCGGPKTWAASKIERPSITRSWNVLRKMGESRAVHWLRCAASSELRRSSSGLGLGSASLSTAVLGRRRTSTAPNYSPESDRLSLCIGLVGCIVLQAIFAGALSKPELVLTHSQRHTLAAVSEDYDRAAYLVLPKGNVRIPFMTAETLLPLLALVAISMVQSQTRHAAIFYCVAGLLSLGFLYFGLEFALRRSRASARRLLAASIVYLPLLFALSATLCNRTRS
jgi:hypothetical protein